MGKENIKNIEFCISVKRCKGSRADILGKKEKLR